MYLLRFTVHVLPEQYSHINGILKARTTVKQLHPFCCKVLRPDYCAGSNMVASMLSNHRPYLQGHSGRLMTCKQLAAVAAAGSCHNHMQMSQPSVGCRVLPIHSGKQFGDTLTYSPVYLCITKQWKQLPSSALDACCSDAQGMDKLTAL